MKVSNKLTLTLIAGILLVHAGDAWVRIQRLVTLFQRDTARDSLVLGRALAHAVERTWTTGGEHAAILLIEHATERESQLDIRWVWLDAPPGSAQAPIASTAQLAPLRRDQPVSMRLGEGETALYTYVPVTIPGDRRGAIQIKHLLHEERTYLLRSVRNVTIATLALVVLCAGLAWVLGDALIGRPVKMLVEQARRVGQGDLSQRLVSQSRDEMGELADEMNRMCDGLQHARDRVASEIQGRISAMEQLRHADRLKTVGTLASGVAHELGTPINVIEGYAQLIREDRAASERAKEGVEVIAKQCKRMTQIIRQLLDFSRRGRADDASSDLRDVARDTVRMLEPIARKRGVTLVLAHGDGAAMGRIAFGQMQQVLTNIVINGIHATPGGGAVSLDVQPVPATAGAPMGEHLCVTVTDTGTGMDDETRKRIFEPFFTTKDVGEGTGLGLAVAYGIIQDYGGWIDVDSEPGQGSRFSIHLPPCPDAAAATSAAEKTS
ncbi:MAG TPA: HAMP domain-containing sensor histidine kinase [Haliangium sp.]|nr:HAMP domain-containing sensor histidine kinase [Haliangium sp.]